MIPRRFRRLERGDRLPHESFVEDDVRTFQRRQNAGG